MKTSKKTSVTPCIAQDQAALSQQMDGPVNDPPKESTYALLVRSEEKGWSLFEAAMYVLLISGPLVALLQFAEYRAVIPISHVL